MCEKHDGQPTTITRYTCKYWWDSGMEKGDRSREGFCLIPIYSSVEEAGTDGDHSCCGLVEIEITLKRVVFASYDDVRQADE